jgi:hypothetical protein
MLRLLEKKEFRKLSMKKSLGEASDEELSQWNQLLDKFPEFKSISDQMEHDEEVVRRVFPRMNRLLEEHFIELSLLLEEDEATSEELKEWQDLIDRFPHLQGIKTITTPESELPKIPQAKIADPAKYSSQLWDAVYKDSHAAYTAMCKQEHADLLVKHHMKIALDKKYQFEKENEPVYSGVDAFRSWMAQEIGARGPIAELSRVTTNLINVNRRLRDPHDPGRIHTTWVDDEYLLQPKDDAAYTEYIEKKEFELCKGNVSEVPGGGFTENWGLITTPAWITSGTGPQPNLSDAEVADIQSELAGLLKSADQVPGHIFTIICKIDRIAKQRAQVINWHDEYLGPRRVSSLTDIWRQKVMLHDAMRMQLQVQRLKNDNEKFTSSGHKGTGYRGTRARPEEVIETTAVDLINTGGMSESLEDIRQRSYPLSAEQPRRSIENLNLSFQIHCRDIDDFIEYWASKYSYQTEYKYDDNIGKPLTKESRLELFDWKNGSPISKLKLKSINKYYPLSFNGDEAERYLNDKERVTVKDLKLQEKSVFTRVDYSKPGGPIWNIFYLHCLEPSKWPIFDQHTYRAMVYLQTGEIVEIGKSNKQVYESYKDEYIPFINEFADIEQRQLDKALFSFGHFLKLAKKYAPQQPGVEGVRISPNTGKPMKKSPFIVKKNKSATLYVDEQGGVFLDFKELAELAEIKNVDVLLTEQIKTAVLLGSAGPDVAPGKAISVKLPVLPAVADLKFCPVEWARGRKIIMARVKLFGEVIDASRHGLWFDEGELVSILKKVQAKDRGTLDKFKQLLNSGRILEDIKEQVDARSAEVRERDEAHDYSSPIG